MLLLLRALLGVAGLLFATQAAQAAPIISIGSFWSVSVDPFYNPALPGGLGISCFGDAASDGAGGCSASAFISQSVTSSAHLTADSSGGLVFSNATGGALSGYIIVSTVSSAFNAGGPAVGLTIDDAAIQGARFSSTVTGRGVGDSHGCSIGTYGNSGTVFSPLSCGVSSPDSSLSSFGFDLSTLAPLSSIQIPYSLSIAGDFFIPVQAGAVEAQATAVPAPPAFLIMLTGLLAMAFASRKTLIAARTRR